MLGWSESEEAKLDPKAIDQAGIRLTRARSAFQALIDAGFDHDKADEAWANFLEAASSIYEKLQQGAKISQSSKNWFNQVKSEREGDPLLSYLHHARNREHHGIDVITVRKDAEPKAIKGATITRKTDGSYDLGLQVGVEMEVLVLPPRIELLPASYGYGKDQFDPPQSHLGIPIDGISPFTVGALALEYLETLIRRASLLI